MEDIAITGSNSQVSNTPLKSNKRDEYFWNFDNGTN